MATSSYEQGHEYAKHIVEQYMRRESLIPMVVRRLRETAQQLDDSFESVVLYCQERIGQLKMSLEQDTAASRECVEEEIAACTERLERLKIQPEAVSPSELKRRYDFLADAAEALFMKYRCDVDKYLGAEINPPRGFCPTGPPQLPPRFEGVPSGLYHDFGSKQHLQADNYAQLFQTEKVTAHRLRERRAYHQKEAERINAREPGTGWAYREPPEFLTALHVPVPYYVFAGVGVDEVELPSLYEQDDATRKLYDWLFKKLCDTLNDMANLVVEQLQNFCLKSEFGMTDSEAHVLFNILPNTVRYSNVYGSDGGSMPSGGKCWGTEFRLVIMWGEPSAKLQKILDDYIAAGRPMSGKVFVEL